MARSRRDGDVARTRKKNSSIIVPATAAQLRGAPFIDVESLDVLVEIAKKYETVVVELPVGTGCDYLLWDDGLVFRFRDTEGQGAAGSPLEQLRVTAHD